MVHFAFFFLTIVYFVVYSLFSFSNILLCWFFVCLCNYLLIKYALFNSIIVQTMCKLGKADSRSAQKCIICVTQIQLIQKKKKNIFFPFFQRFSVQVQRLYVGLKGPVFCCAVKFLFFYITLVFYFFCNKTMHYCFCNLYIVLLYHDRFNSPKKKNRFAFPKRLLYRNKRSTSTNE